MDLRNKIGGIAIDKLPLISTMVREFEESKKVILKNVKKFRRIAFEQMNEEVRKELANTVTVIGGLAIIYLLLDEAHEIYVAIVNELASMFPELQSSRNEVVHKASIENALAFYLFTLIYWYAVFEPIVSIVRYPNTEKKSAPLDINENTVDVQRSKEIIQFIDKTDMLTCVKGFIEEKPETTRCLEILKTIEKHLKVVKVEYE